MKRLCTICARGGSVGVPGKNIRPLAGKPLIAYSIQQAQEAGLFDCIAVSSDSLEILSTAKEFGVDFLVERPSEMATSASPKVPVIVHCLRTIEERLETTFETIVDLDATSPLRGVDDIRAAVELLETHGGSNVITGAPARRSPYFNLVEINADGFVHLSKTPDKPVVTRQSAPACFDMNASIYVWTRRALMESPVVFYHDTRLLVMPEERSIDIDSELDFEFVEFLMAKKCLP